MSTDPTPIRSIIQNAREALRRGDQSEARRLAEQAARLAPEMEDGWLILAAVSSPRESLQYANRALKINPQSTRARKAVDWARNRLSAEAPSTRTAVPTPPPAGSAKGEPVERSEPEAQEKPKRRGWLIPVLVLVGLMCVVVAFAAVWAVRKSSAMAFVAPKINEPVSTPTLESNFTVADIAKPTYTPIWTLTPSLTPTLTPTATPSITPTLEFTSTPPFTDTPLPTDTPGQMEVSIVADTPVPPVPAAGAAPAQPVTVPSGVGNSTRWIDINLSTQSLYAYEGDVMVKGFIVSTGVSATPTVTGTYKIYARYLYADMHGPGYFLPDVPYTMYFYKSYGIHGTYWHNNFGTPMSHGCVNMSIADAGWVYNWSTFGTTVKVHY